MEYNQEFEQEMFMAQLTGDGRHFRSGIGTCKERVLTENVVTHKGKKVQ